MLSHSSGPRLCIVRWYLDFYFLSLVDIFQRRDGAREDIIMIAHVIDNSDRYVTDSEHKCK